MWNITTLWNQYSWSYGLKGHSNLGPGITELNLPGQSYMLHWTKWQSHHLFYIQYGHIINHTRKIQFNKILVKIWILVEIWIFSCNNKCSLNGIWREWVKLIWVGYTWISQCFESSLLLACHLFSSKSLLMVNGTPRKNFGVISFNIFFKTCIQRMLSANLYDFVNDSIC